MTLDWCRAGFEAMSGTPEQEQWDTRKVILLTGLGATMLITIILVTAEIMLMLFGKPIPSELNQWASMALGFLFGTFGTILQDFASK